MQIKLLFACLAMPLTASSAFAVQQYNGTAYQVPMARAQGMFSGAPIGLQLTTNVLPGSEQSLLIREAGTTTGTLIPWTTSLGSPGLDFPNYSPEALFAHWVPAAIGAPSWHAAYTPELGGMSTGGDVTPPVDQNGVLDLTGPLKWFSLSISLGAKSKGLPNSLINAMAVDSNGEQVPGSDGNIFSYMAEGSTGIAPGHVNTVRVDYSRQQLSLTPTGAVHPGVKAIDWGMGRIATTSNGTPSHLQPTRDRFYFTLTKRWLTRHALTSSQSFEWTPATIYEMEWDAVTGWSDPVVAYGRADLLDSTITNAEIDALSVFGAPYIASTGSASIGPRPRRVVFSLTNAARSTVQGQPEFVDQILVSQMYGQSVKSKPLSVDTATGIKTFSEQFGLDEGDINDPEGTPDDVDATCSQDPGAEAQGSLTYLVPDTDLASPLASSHEASDDMSISMSRVEYGSDTQLSETLVLSASGGDRDDYLHNFVYFRVQLVEVGDSVDIISETLSSPILVLAGDNSVEDRFPLVRPTSPTSGHYEMRAQAIHVGLGLPGLPGVLDVGLSKSWTCAIKL